MTQITINGTFSPLTTPVLKVLKKVSAQDRAEAKRREKEQQREKDNEKEFLRTPYYRHVIHKPTFCVVVHHNALDEPLLQERHQLSNFKSKIDTMSALAVTRMKTALNWQYLFADKKRLYSKQAWKNSKGHDQHEFTFSLAFITLTLSDKQKHTDEEIKDRMLKPFLHWLTRSYHASYVWKAETQLNGNIHFHLTIDTFIHWKSVRAKWNKLLSQEGYCKMLQDGTNDKGDSATQIKAIKNEKGHAKIVGGYLTKGSIEEKYYSDLKDKKITIDELLQHSEGCSCSIETKKTYTRFVAGRLWGQSESLSNIDISHSDCNADFQDSEKAFFQNNKIKKLSTVMFEEAKLKRLSLTPGEISVMGFDDLSLKKKFQRYENVFIHKHLKTCRIPDGISKMIVRERDNRTFNTQRSFTVDSLF